MWYMSCRRVLRKGNHIGWSQRSPRQHNISESRGRFTGGWPGQGGGLHTMVTDGHVQSLFLQLWFQFCWFLVDIYCFNACVSSADRLITDRQRWKSPVRTNLDFFSFRVTFVSFQYLGWAYNGKSPVPCQCNLHITRLNFPVQPRENQSSLQTQWRILRESLAFTWFLLWGVMGMAPWHQHTRPRFCIPSNYIPFMWRLQW